MKTSHPRSIASLRVVLFVLVIAIAPLGQLPAQTFTLEKQAHVSLIGNTLAERMQHDGWMETMLHARFPQHELVIRNLGYSGDELTLRLRSQDFGSPDQWLTKNQTDVMFAFFGYNESHSGAQGLKKFKDDLDQFIKNSLSQKYNGNTPPRIVLFSPIAHENVHNVHVPDGTANNASLETYTEAMKQVADANKVPMVDLFHPMLEYLRSTVPNKKQLTINGIHLNDEGNRWLASVIDQKLFGKPVALDATRLQSIQAAVTDKNFYWFNRYRTVDGFSIYGGRADLQFTNGQTNREVMQREMEVLDVMTANRDKVVWAAAQGKSLKPDDSNLPPFIPVISNKPGSGPNGAHVFLTGEEAVARMKVGDGMRVELVADETKFPDLINPVQMAFDTKGRLWVATWPTYPHWKPTEPMNDKLLILVDKNGDGKTDETKVFADGLHSVTGFEFWNGGVLVAVAPDLLFLKDTNGDDVADVRERIVHGLDSADTHHTSNSFTLDPGGALYFQEGTFHHTQTETPYSGAERCANAGVFRYDPRRMKFEVYVSHGFANPHGHVFGRWAEEIVHDGTGAQPYDGALFSGHLSFPDKHPSPPQVYGQRTRPCPGTEILSSKHFPDDMQGDLLVGNVIGFQGILRYHLREEGGSYGADEAEPVVFSDDPNFRPSDLEIGPDGALYFTDWQNPIIGHMQHNLRDPNRDRVHGRVYRVTYPERPLAKPAAIAGAPIPQLVELLKSPENRVRYRAKIELSNRDTQQVLAAVNTWLKKLDPKDPEILHHQMEALWVHQHHDVANRQLLETLLSSADHRARAAATRVVCYWRDRIDDPLPILVKMAADEHPRVRLEAVRAASFFDGPQALEVAIIAAQLPSDRFLDYVQQETRRVLEPAFKKALAAGESIHMTSEAGQKFVLQNLSLEQLLKLPKDRSVYQEMLLRGGLQDDVRLQAIAGLAVADKKPEIEILLSAINDIDAKEQVKDGTVVFDLVRLLANRPQEQLAQARGQVEKLALQAKQPAIRQMAFVSLMLVDKSVDKAWDLGMQSITAMRDLVSATPLLSDASLRAQLYSRITPLLTQVPDSLSSPGVNDQGSYARYVRIEIPGPATLTLAEVEVYSEGQNVARRGTAKQSQTAHGGDASRAIDGNTNATYGAGGQTHTPEGAANPWWEVDLGQSVPVEQIVIFNRMDGNLGERLNNFSMIVMDENRQVIFCSEKNAAPKPKTAIALEGGGAAGMLRQSAMKALVSIRGQEANTFAALAPFVSDKNNRAAAIRALRQLPAATWPKEQAVALVQPVLDYIRTVPIADRTSPSALEAMEFAEALTLSLEPDAAKKSRAELRELGVQVIRVGTVLERMSYDKETLAIQAGKPVEFLFENSDLMPHNFVILPPGALEEVGMLAEATAQDPKSAERQYVPQSDKILLASRLLQPRDSQRLSFVAPTQPGIYPYVCTYPGHWRRMYGALYVVADLDAYLADSAGYLAQANLEVKDDLLKDRRPRTEWSYDELAASMPALEQGRAYNNGKQIFTVANCISCHKMDGVGQPIGPDLTKLAEEYKPADILREMLDPSAKINEKFQTYAILTNDGKVITGLILEENADELKIIENPLAKAEPTTIKIEDIESRTKSKTSIMPKGLLDKLTRDEILDLVAYVTARGDQHHPVVQAQSHHHDH